MRRVLIGVCLVALAATTNAQEPDPRGTTPPGNADARGANDVRRVTRPAPGRYIVMLRGDDDPEAVGLETAILRGGRLRHVFRTAARGFAIELPEPAARALAGDPRVDYVEEDGIVSATSGVQTGAPWGLDRVDQRSLPLDTEYHYAGNGTGVHVHVVDTGIRVTHTDFGGRAFIAADYVDDDFDGDPFDVGNDDSNPGAPDGSDCNGHGTHVAGTVGGATYGVAKNATLWGHRVLDCMGFGFTSGVIAAIDAVTADTTRRPAVLNMSLGGPPSIALDNAVRNSVAAGVVNVVAAGNQNLDASSSSPARVVEAITVGATDASDTRASFSNFGSLLDVFAPGDMIESAGIASDIAVETMSGTSMAAPHASGVAALYLEANPGTTPAAVRDALVTSATPGVVANRGVGSPNLLLYSLGAAVPPITVTVLTPNGGEKLFTAASYAITWTAENVPAGAVFDLYVSTNGGTTFNEIPGCTSLPADRRDCTWAAPGPTTSAGRIMVSARTAATLLTADESDGSFVIVSGSPVVKVTSPNTAVNWGRGSTQQIRWNHNLGATASVKVEISRDGGASYSVIAPSVMNTTATTGEFAWQVTGPNTSAAIVRVSWTSGPAIDTSNTSFVIADPFVTLTIPGSGTNWGYGTDQQVKWKSNLGPADRVRVLLSVNGGTTFPHTLATDVAGNAAAAMIVTPTLGSPTTAARVRVQWTNAPAGFSAVGTSPANFRVEPPFVRVTAPNGGETWVSGTTGRVRWVSNLGKFENVRIDLSVDGGASYGIVVNAATPSDGALNRMVESAWLTSAARIRVRWLENSAVSDISDVNFLITSAP